MSDDESTRTVIDGAPPLETPLPVGRANLVVLEGRHVGRRFPVDGTTTIGRGDTAHIRVDDTVTSRVHAILRLRESEWVVEDAGSHNGTYLNGIPITTQPIRFGDRLQIGGTLFLFSHRDPLEERIRHRQKLEMLGRLGAGVAHDMNNLLASVLANAEMIGALLPEAHRTAEISECLGDIVVATRQGAELTRRIVEHAQQGASEDSTVDLSAVTLEACELVRRTFDSTIRVEKSIEAGICVRGNRAALGQVVMNLLVNARDSMSRGGTMRVRMGAVGSDVLPPAELGFAGRYVQLEVEDQGVGIAPEIRARVFEPFFSTKAAEAGSGLGLATVAEIVGEHGGRVSFDSKLGEGTTFRIVLPALSTSGPTRPAMRTPLATLRPERNVGAPGAVLLVDDDPLVRRAIGRSLTRDGIAVIEAADGRAALEIYAARAAEIGLVLLDLDMPELDGEATFHALAERAPDVKVVFLTGLCDDAKKEALRARGARGILGKPCPTDLLRRVVRTELLGLLGAR